MKKTLSVAIVSVLALGIGAQSYAFGGQGSESDHLVSRGGKGGAMSMGAGLGLGGGMGQGKKSKHGGEKMNHMMDVAIMDAIKAKDYDAFVKAWTANKKTVPTQEEFTIMVTHENAHNALEAAIMANNYEGFKTALANMPKPTTTGTNMLKNRSIPTQEQFVKMVEVKKSHNALELAIQNNNYSAFTAAIADLPKVEKRGRGNKTPVVPTQEEFAKMVELSKKRAAVRAAVTSNNYNAFVAAWTANQPTVPTKEEFAKIVEKHTNMPKKGGMIKRMIKKLKPVQS
ncbi:MAG: hypothetical protein WC004_02510 [Candidatus Absconditabacterales bacterium]